MSKLSKKVTEIPKGVKFEVQEEEIVFTGPAGIRKMVRVVGIEIVEKKAVLEDKDDQVSSAVCNFEKDDQVSSAIFGTFIANFRNCLKGVDKGFEKTLNLVGVGYKVAKKGDDLEFNLGYSHPVLFKAQKDINFEVKKPTLLVVSGCNNITLGDVCARISIIRKYDPYKGKGVLIQGKFYARKEGKKK